jgi:hypothetical protein
MQGWKRKKKNPLNKNQGLQPIHQKCKANENRSRHYPKKKQKQTINKNQVIEKKGVSEWIGLQHAGLFVLPLQI